MTKTIGGIEMERNPGTDAARNLKVGFGIPAYGGKISMEHAQLWMDVGHVLATNEQRFTLTMFATIDVCGIDRARNLLVKNAIDAQCDWLVMLDADTWVADGVQLLRMVSDADRQGYQVVAAAVPRRNTDGTRELMIYNEDNEPSWDDSVGWRHPPHAQLLHPIAAAATACMAINIPFVAAKLDQPTFRFTATQSEDLDFCRRVREAGGQVCCDPRVQAFHLNRPQILTGLSTT